jgi:methionyl-tRNA formyltransferase
MEMGSKLIVKTLDGLSENSIQEKPQPQVAEPKNAYKIFKEDMRIQWQNTSKVVHQFILGMSPYPAAFTTLKISEEVKSLKIFDGKFELKNHTQKSGTLEISKNNFSIYTQDGIYHPTELQLEGKKRMNVKDFLNGFRDFENISIQ